MLLSLTNSAPSLKIPNQDMMERYNVERRHERSAYDIISLSVKGPSVQLNLCASILAHISDARIF